MKVRAQFDNTDNALFPNQFVNARLLVETLQNVVTVPTSAIQRGSPGTYVYVINADSTVSVRQIKTGAVDGDLTAVEIRTDAPASGWSSTAPTGCATAFAFPLPPASDQPAAAGRCAGDKIISRAGQQGHNSGDSQN